MRVLAGCLSWFGSRLRLRSAADLKVKVVDPQSAAVAGAQVSLVCPAGESKVSRDAELLAPKAGAAVSHARRRAIIRSECLPPALLPRRSQFFIRRRNSPCVCIWRLPRKRLWSARRAHLLRARLPELTSLLLNDAQLTSMQPIAANDAMRFLPGAVVNTAGQHGGLASLFVRGGESNYNKVIVDGVTVNEPGGTFDSGTLPLAQARSPGDSFAARRARSMARMP